MLTELLVRLQNRDLGIVVKRKSRLLPGATKGEIRRPADVPRRRLRVGV
jgi:hypothetical protein